MLAPYSHRIERADAEEQRAEQPHQRGGRDGADDQPDAP